MGSKVGDIEIIVVVVVVVVIILCKLNWG